MRVFTRYDKLDAILSGFILFVMIVDSIVRALIYDPIYTNENCPFFVVNRTSFAH